MSYKKITFKNFEGNTITCNAETVGQRCSGYLDYFRCGQCKNQVPSDADNGACHSFFDNTVTYDITDTKRYCLNYEQEQN